MNLYEKLTDYKKTDYYPFHMPGHKRNTGWHMENPYGIDITEIDGFDNLHHPMGILKERMELASQFYQTKKTYYLVNGSTCGLLGAISCVTSYGDEIIVARNCHKAVYHAIELRGLKPAYVYPEYIDELDIQGGIKPESVLKTLKEYPQAKAVVITSPTYEGIVSDMKAIAQLVHAHNKLLIVDEAHGAHLSLHPAFPVSSAQLGADIVIQSLHKTMPSMTQTALLHVTSDSVDIEKLEKYLQIYQSSSPSYVLMASIDRCMEWMYSGQAGEDFMKYVELLKLLWGNLSRFKALRFFTKKYIGQYGVFDMDPSKLLISVKDSGYSGRQLYDKLRDQFHLQMEMTSADYVLAMTGVMDTQEGINRLLDALEKIDRHIRLYIKNEEDESYELGKMEPAIVYETIAGALEKDMEVLAFSQAAGRISGEYVYLYPPGIPIVAPGEMITGEIIRRCQLYENLGLELQGAKDSELKTIHVIKEQWSSLDVEQVFLKF